ncbi:MAG: L,D-transpeptidase [Gammaproteobacteria bacterium]|nr:L,D-transpeptidase [Gammaproteobacteria bacterium]
MNIQKMSLVFIYFLVLSTSTNIYADGEEDEYSFVTPGDTPSYRGEYPAQTSSDDVQDAFREPDDNSTYRERIRDPEPDDVYASRSRSRNYRSDDDFHPDMPARIAATGERVIIVNPNIHAWGAYSAKGELLHSGVATAGARWCSDIGRPCKTGAGTFRIKSLGSEDCVSKIYPVGEGGAPMPYCMFFNGGQGLHGSHEVVAGNISHGCVRLHVSDARWIRYNFATIGTKVIVKPY